MRASAACAVVALFVLVLASADPCKFGENYSAVWSAVAPSTLDLGTSGNIALVDGSFVAVGSKFDQVWSWSKNSWAKVSVNGGVPPARGSYSLAGFNGKLYLFGGIGRFCWSGISLLKRA